MSNLLMSFNPLHKHPLLCKATLGTPFYTATYLVTSLPHLFFHVPFVPQHLSSSNLSSQGYGFSSGCVWMWELDCEESWVLKDWWFWTVVLEKTPESPLDYKEIHLVLPKRDQSWVFTGRTDVEAETPILWPPDAKNWLTGKDPDAGKDWG